MRKGFISLVIISIVLDLFACLLYFFSMGFVPNPSLLGISAVGIIFFGTLLSFLLLAAFIHMNSRAPEATATSIVGAILLIAAVLPWATAFLS
ncbi:MAG: hypothetical protein JWO73_570, partial [Candidatus Taylorbacteria bacterium]|nr:hypothetical protein [Candidatus Taylorbacteria bacterium]